MSFNFTSERDQVLKVLMTEREKARMEAESVKDSFEILDALKRIYKVKISSTVEALEEYERLGAPEGVLKRILNAEEYYILLNQTLLLATITHEEMVNLNKQICIRFKMYLGQTLTKEEQSAYIQYSMQDLNEMLRYIYVWDIDHGLQARIKSLTNAAPYDRVTLQPEAMHAFAINGYLPYFERVRDLYFTASKDLAYFAQVTFFKHFDILKKNMDSLNEVMHYEPIHSYDYDDGARDPIGYSVDKEYYNQFYNEMVAKYKQNLAKIRSNEQGREL